MGWATSAIFQQAMLNPISKSVNAGSGGTGFTSLTADAVKVAVFNNTGTPSKSVSLANTAYAVDQWVTGNEVTGTGWSAGGVAVGTTKTWTVDSGSSSLCYQVTAPTAGQTSTAGVTLAGFFGALVYDSAVSSPTANPGICFNFFGGTQTITAGVFTILWATPVSAAVTAIFNITV